MDKSIKQEIAEKAIPENVGKSIHLGWKDELSLAPEDAEELKSWTIHDGVTRIKTVNGVEFTIAIYLSDKEN